MNSSCIQSYHFSAILTAIQHKYCVMIALVLAIVSLEEKCSKDNTYRKDSTLLIMTALESYKPVCLVYVVVIPLLHCTFHDMALSLFCSCLLLDFSKAFDSVPHERLLFKLEIIRIQFLTRHSHDQ